ETRPTGPAIPEPMGPNDVPQLVDRRTPVPGAPAYQIHGFTGSCTKSLVAPEYTWNQVLPKSVERQMPLSPSARTVWFVESLRSMRIFWKADGQAVPSDGLTSFQIAPPAVVL